MMSPAIASDSYVAVAEDIRLLNKEVPMTPGAAMIRIVLPVHLRNLAQIGDEVEIDVAGPVTQRAVLDAVEAQYPVLRGTIRDHVTKQRRAFLRFFACGEDLSHESPDTPLPEKVINGEEPYLVVGAMAGG